MQYDHISLRFMGRSLLRILDAVSRGAVFRGPSSQRYKDRSVHMRAIQSTCRRPAPSSAPCASFPSPLRARTRRICSHGWPAETRRQAEVIWDPFRGQAARRVALEHPAECAAADALREHGFDAPRDVVLVRERKRRPHRSRSTGAWLLHEVISGALEGWHSPRFPDPVTYVARAECRVLA